MTKEFGFQELSRQAGTIEIDKGFISTWAVFMQPTRQHAFPGSSLAENQYRTFGSENSFCLFCQATNCGTRADERIDRLPYLPRLTGQLLVMVSLSFEESLQDHLQRWQFEWFSKELFRAFFNGPNCEID